MEVKLTEKEKKDMMERIKAGYSQALVLPLRGERGFRVVDGMGPAAGLMDLGRSAPTEDEAILSAWEKLENLCIEAGCIYSPMVPVEDPLRCFEHYLKNEDKKK